MDEEGRRGDPAPARRPSPAPGGSPPRRRRSPTTRMAPAGQQEGVLAGAAARRRGPSRPGVAEGAAIDEAHDGRLGTADVPGRHAAVGVRGVEGAGHAGSQVRADGRVASGRGGRRGADRWSGDSPARRRRTGADRPARRVGSRTVAPGPPARDRDCRWRPGPAGAAAGQRPRRARSRRSAEAAHAGDREAQPAGSRRRGRRAGRIRRSHPARGRARHAGRAARPRHAERRIPATAIGPGTGRSARRGGRVGPPTPIDGPAMVRRDDPREGRARDSVEGGVTRP